MINKFKATVVDYVVMVTTDLSERALSLWNSTLVSFPRRSCSAAKVARRHSTYVVQ